MRGLLLIFLAGLPFSVSCKASPEASGTLTNWLAACESDAECPQESSCQCGLCTRACDSASNCDGGFCATGLALDQACGAKGASTPDNSICLPGKAPACTELPVDSNAVLGSLDAADCVAGALLCESFDTPFPSSYATLDGGPSVLEDCDIVQGSGAIRFDGAQRETYMPLKSAVPDGPLFIRLYVKLPASTVLADDTTILRLKPGGLSNSTQAIELGLSASGGLRFSQRASLAIDSPKMPRDEWVCVQVAVTAATTATASAVTVRQGGAIVLDATGLPEVPISGYDTAVLAFGQTTDSSSILIDELVIGTEDIGCL